MVRGRFILLLLIILFISLFIGKFIPGISLKLPLFLSLGLAVAIVTFVKPDIGLMLLIFSMLLSPEIKLAEVPGRDVVVRVDDLLLIIVSLTWLARMAVNKELGLLKSTPLNKPIGIYILVCFISTSIGVFVGRVHPTTGIFYLLKYMEYFLIFFMVVNSIETREQVVRYVFALLTTGFLISIYSTSQIGKVARLSAPFEGAVGEPNTLGCYLLIIFALAIGISIYADSKRVKYLSGGIGAFSVLPFLYTLSRSSYMAFPPMYFTLMSLGKAKKWLTGALIAGVVLFAFLKPEAVVNRIKYTFTGEKPYSVTVLGTELGPSASDRIRSWRGAMREWADYPFLGTGVTGWRFLDGQYMRTLVETGIVGIVAIFYLIFSILKHSLRIFRQTEDNLYKGLSLGLVAAFVGILFHAVTANSFIIIRIMEPFWFLTGMVMAIPGLQQEV
ncbi:MAG: O-antigen ligase family protein [bacterium]|nr:O-antigen ligase family protein [bacterium]